MPQFELLILSASGGYSAANALGMYFIPEAHAKDVIAWSFLPD
jgi:hypothetical protein